MDFLNINKILALCLFMHIIKEHTFLIVLSIHKFMDIKSKNTS